MFDIAEIHGKHKQATDQASVRCHEQCLTSIKWPAIEELAFPPAELERRQLGIGGSDANIILSGEADRITALWLEKRGEAAPPDLSGNLNVALGSWTEPFNRQWFERVTGHRVSNDGLALVCSTYDWRRCTLDGIVSDTGAVFEAKHTNAFTKSEDVLQRYMPQLQHNMAVAKSDRAILSVLFGNHKFEVFEVAADWLYQLELLEAEENFWRCVLEGDRPSPAIPPESPKALGIREVCLEGNNAWANAAGSWLENREGARLHADAMKIIKSLVEPDVARAFGHGIEARRSKAGALTIRELAQ